LVQRVLKCGNDLFQVWGQQSRWRRVWLLAVGVWVGEVAALVQLLQSNQNQVRKRPDQGECRVWVFAVAKVLLIRGRW
jgi:hypothetical protein